MRDFYILETIFASEITITTMASVVSVVVNNVPTSDYYNNTGIDGATYNISREGNLFRSNETIDPSSVTKNLMVPSAMFFFGVLGNVTALIILTVRPSKDSKTTAFYHLVKALVCMDLFGIIASSPVTIVVYIKQGVIDTGGMPLCHYFSFILVLAGNATVFTVLVMAAERFMVTKYPFKYSTLVKPLTVNCCILVVWGLSTFIALLPIFGMGRNIEPWPGTWCFFDYRSTSIAGQIFSYFYATAGLVAILITMILNLYVMQHLWRMRRSRLSTILAIV
uniref:G-protein coupled receptors family 1 profile domain-containing protein n=1 Tax=Arion vulgaris TaxID=1028688 RepID=A0A0B7A0I2_9EUPU